MFNSGIHIDFAWQSFIWSSEASLQAHVYVVIVGFSRMGINQRLLFLKNGNRQSCVNINGYLQPAINVFIDKRNQPLCDVPEVSKGFQATDNGFLLMYQEGYEKLISVDPSAQKWIRPFSMGADFIKGDKRYCLWLVNATEEDIQSHHEIAQRVESCKIWRSEQKITGDAYKLRNTPHLLRPCNKFHDVTYIGIPKVTSSRRNYVPFGFVTNGMIPGDKLYFAETDSLYHFGILMSQFQNAWMRIVAGRLGDGYSYSNTIVYNNFVWPEATSEQKETIEKTAKAILDTRSKYPNQSLADLYDPDKMPADLLSAHKANDAAVEAAYGVDFNGDEEKIVAHLFKLYAEKLKSLT